MTLRHPKATLIVAGQNIPCTELSVKQSRDANCDTFSATAPIDLCDVANLSSANNLTVEAIIEVDGKSGRVFDGYVDQVDVDWESREVHMSGRDKVSKMLDKKSSAKHLNKKPNDIVSYYAGQSGIPVEADSVSEKAGKIFQIDYVGLMHRVSDWTAVQALADLHNMMAYATGGKLYFKKYPEQLPVFSVYYVRPTAGNHADSNAIKIRTSRNLVLGRPVKSHVKSWNHKQAKKVEAVSEEPGSGDPLEYFNHHPGLTQEQANARAKSHRDKATRHEMNVTVEMPGDPTLNARFMLQLSGTRSAWDQEHEISEVEHKVSFHGGYVMTIETKAKSKKRGK